MRELHTINLWRPLLTSAHKVAWLQWKIGLFMTGNMLYGEMNLASACMWMMLGVVFIADLRKPSLRTACKVWFQLKEEMLSNSQGCKCGWWHNGHSGAFTHHSQIPRLESSWKSLRLPGTTSKTPGKASMKSGQTAEFFDARVAQHWYRLHPETCLQFMPNWIAVVIRAHGGNTRYYVCLS